MRSPTLVGVDVDVTLVPVSGPSLAFQLDAVSAVLLIGAAPEVSALGGEVQASAFVHHDGGAHIARVAGHIGQIQHAAGCVKIRDAPPVQQAIVAAEVDVGAVAHRAGPVEAVAVGGEGLHRVVGELDLIVGSRVAAAGPGAEVQVGPVGGDGGVDLAIDAGQDIRHSGFVLIQAGTKPVYNMLPYIISLIVLAFTSKKSLAPKAEGIPYDKGSR